MTCRMIQPTMKWFNQQKYSFNLGTVTVVEADFEVYPCSLTFTHRT